MPRDPEMLTSTTAADALEQIRADLAALLPRALTEAEDALAEALRERDAARRRLGKAATWEHTRTPNSSFRPADVLDVAEAERLAAAADAEAARRRRAVRDARLAYAPKFAREIARMRRRLAGEMLPHLAALAAIADHVAEIDRFATRAGQSEFVNFAIPVSPAAIREVRRLAGESE